MLQLAREWFQPDRFEYSLIFITIRLAFIAYFDFLDVDRVVTHFLTHKILLKNQQKFYTFIAKNMKLLKFIYFNNFIPSSSETYKFSLVFK